MITIFFILQRKMVKFVKERIAVILQYQIENLQQR